jgi:hypothetical protein
MKGKRAGQFVKGLRKGREKRDRISLVKESTLYSQRKSSESSKGNPDRGIVALQADLEPTVTGSALPSFRTRYIQGRRGRSSDKLYGEKAYLKGINKRPRRKLTLGNRVTRKKRKRVEGGEVKDTQRVGGQRHRQRIRVVWDVLNRERRKQYRKFRKTGKRERSESQLRSKKGLIEARERYRAVREVEVYRNTYEVRSRVETHERGGRRKKWRLEAKYRMTTPVQGFPLSTEKKDSDKRTWVEKTRREGVWQEEEGAREKFHQKRREEVRREFKVGFDRREKRVSVKKERRKIAHLRSLVERSKQTRIQPIQRKNRVQRLQSSGGYGRREINENQIKEEFEVFRGKDDEVEILRALPTTQYFAKVKNLTRMRERRSEPRDESGRSTVENEQVKKRRKVPEKKRHQRYPHWTELEVWSNQFMQKVEDLNLQKVLKGEPVDLSYATYRELGKKVVYFYAVERSEREGKKQS